MQLNKMIKYTILIQASSITYSGGRDLCLNILDGKTILENTINKILDDFQDQINIIYIIAPEFDRGGEFDNIVNKYKINGDTINVYYGFNESPLLRMQHVINTLPDDEVFLRVNSLNFCLDTKAALKNLQKAKVENLDCIKFADSFPALFTSDVYKVGAIKKVANIENLNPKYHIHPKYYMQKNKDFSIYEYIPNTNDYTDDILLKVRKKSINAMHEQRIEVVSSKSVSSGDAISHHYNMALKYLKEDMNLLDLACGNGFGAKIISSSVSQVIALDIDKEIIAQSNKINNTTNIKFLWGDALKMPFNENSFNCCLAFEILEHLNPEELLLEIYRVLKKDGLLILSTPQNSLGHIPITADHIYEYSQEGLKSKVSKFFSIIEFIGLKQGIISFEGDESGANSFLVAKKVVI